MTSFNWDDYEKPPEKQFDWYQYEKPIEKEKTFYEKLTDFGDPNRERKGILDSFGQGLAYNSQVSNAVTPEGAGKLGRSLASGATIGLSEHIPGFKTEDNALEDIGKFTGSFAPIAGITKAIGWAGKPIMKLIEKSPVLAKQLGSLAEIIGTGIAGSTYKATEDVFQGKAPEIDDLLSHGSQWAMLDAALKTLGVGGQFAAKLFNKAKSNPEKFKLINDFVNENKSDFTSTERVSAKVMEFLEQNPKQTSNKKIDLSKKPISKEVETANEQLRHFTDKEISDLSKKKISREDFEYVARKGELDAKEYLPDELIADNIEKKIIENGENSVLEEISPRAKTEQELGLNVSKEVEEGLELANQKVKPLYDYVNKAAENIKHSPKTQISLANEILTDLNSLKTKPEGYKKVIDTLKTTLEDMGYTLKIFEGGKAHIIDAKGNRISLKPSQLQIFEDIPLSKSIELSKRLNKIIDFDLEGGSIKNRLKPVGKSLKDEVREVLKKHNPEAADMLKLADSEYAETAKKYGRDSIQKIRSTEAKEKIVSLLNSPTALQDLKAVISEKQFAQIEREIIEKIRDMSLTKARDTLRNIGNELSAKGREVVNNIVEGKLPTVKSLPSQRQRLKSDFIKGLSKDILQGERPQNALDLWKTQKGQMFIKDSLKGNPNAEQMLNYLEKQSFFDFAKSILTPEGQVNYKTFKQLIKDPATRANLEMVGGKDAVKFFDNLEMFSNKLDKNLKIRENLPIDKIAKPNTERGKDLLKRAAEKSKQPSKETLLAKEKIREKLAREKETTGEKGKQLLKKGAEREAPFAFKSKEFFEGLPITVKVVSSLMGLFTYGPVKYLGAAKATQYLYKLATRPKVRSDMIKAVTISNTNPIDSLGYLDKVGKALIENTPETESKK